MEHVTISMIIGSVVNLAIFFAVIVIAAKKPLAKGLQDRSDKVANLLKTAETQLSDITAKIAEQKKQLGDLQSQVADIKTTGEATSKKLAEEVVAAAKSEGEAMRIRVAREVDAELQLSIQRLRRELSREALGSAERILRERLDQSRQSELVNNFATQLTGAANGHHGGNN